MIPESLKTVQLIQPRTTNGGFTSDWISLKNVKRAYVIVELTQAVGHATLLTVNQATAVAGTGSKALTNNCRVWANEDVAASDTQVRKTDAKNYAVAADIKNKQVIFDIDPAECLDLAGEFDCVSITAADSAQATNFASITAVLEMKYAPADALSVIVD